MRSVNDPTTPRALSRSPESSLTAAAATAIRDAASTPANHAPWWHEEHVIPLAVAPQHLPIRADGSRWSTSAIYRWSSPVGKYGVRLRRFRTGPRGWMTTVEELQRFAVAMTSIAGEDVL